jgi:signal transduction histidine kinase
MLADNGAFAPVSREADGQQATLSSVAAGRPERTIAFALVLISAIAFAVSLPFASQPLPKVAAFIPTYESALAINDLITAVLLFGQFARLRSRALLVLASGYLFSALIIIPHALSFPGVFAETGLLGAGPETTVWLYVFWHAGFPLFVLAYAVLRDDRTGGGTIGGRTSAWAAGAVGAVLAIVIGLATWATAGHDSLPRIMQGNDYSMLVTKGITPAVLLLTVAALLMLRRRRRPTKLDLWLMVVMTAWLFDVTLSAVMSSARYDLGWYAGRTYGLFAASFVLVVLLLETNELHMTLARAQARLEEHARSLEARVRERTNELMRSNENLNAEVIERKQTEEQLRQAQKMEAIGNLTGGLAHDFNNLLAVIVSSLDLLRDRVNDKVVDELAGDALDAAMRGAELTRRLLAFARRQPLQPALIDVNTLVDDMTKLLRRTLGENIEIDVRLVPGVWPVVADPTQLEASLANLATNARDAMPSGGRLTISTANRELDADYAAQHPEVTPGEFAMIEVSDTGTGMPPEVASHIFEPFFTTKESGKGTGLGLSMVFGFVKQSGGHINVYSEPGVGTTFRLYLPRNANGGEKDVGPAVEELPRGQGQTVLVVEDNPALRRIVMRQVSEIGYRALEADNAAAALAILEHQPVDLVFTDVVMPGRFSGLDLAATVADCWPQVRVVLTSGFPGKVGGRLDPMTTRLLSKPYRKADLARAFHSVFQEPAKTL